MDERLQLIVTIAAATARAALLEAAKPCIVATRAEPGCLHYACYADREDPGLIYFVETWTDDTALAAHVASAHFKAFAAAVDAAIPGGFAGATTIRRARAVEPTG